jgi:hypothetical protein
VFVKDGVMASVTLEMDLPEGVVVSSYERVGMGTALKFAGPCPSVAAATAASTKRKLTWNSRIRCR